MRFILPIGCIATFCIITLVVAHTVIPLGLPVFAIVTNADGAEPIWERVIALTPFMVLGCIFFSRSKLLQCSLFIAGSLILVVYALFAGRNGLNATAIPFFAVVLFGNLYFLKSAILDRRKRVTKQP